MSTIYFILPSALFLSLSFLIVKAGATALMMTGMDRKSAEFQALSAFTMTGFTTREADLILDHPRRRDIISWMMRIGSAGVVIVIVTMTTSFVRSGGIGLPVSIFILVAATFLTSRLVNHTRLGRKWEIYVRDRFLAWRFLPLDPIEILARLPQGVSMVRVFVPGDSPLVGHPASQLIEGHPSSSLIGIERGGRWLSPVAPEESALEGDHLLVFGMIREVRGSLRTPSDRRAGT